MRAGDQVSAKVTYDQNTGVFTTTLTVTSGGSTIGTLTQSLTVSGAQSDSAEWDH